MTSHDERIFFISDLHYGANKIGDLNVREMAAWLHDVSRPMDALIIGGDIATNDEKLRECLHLHRRFRGTRMAIPGNHDVWVQDGSGDDSVARFERLTDIFRDGGFRRLDDEPVIIGETAFVGSMGWYDYSFADDIGVAREHYERKTLPGKAFARWMDEDYVRWPFSDTEVCERMIERLGEHLSSVSRCSRIVAAMHHLPTSRLLFRPRFLVPKRWRFLNAFLGSDRFGDLLANYRDKVTVAFCGHIHRAAQTHHNGVRCVSNGGDYDHKSCIMLEADGTIERLTFLFA